MSLNYPNGSRRRFIKTGFAGLVGAVAVNVAGIGRDAAAAELPRLDEADSTAKALKYVHDASTVSAEARGGATRVCATCRFYPNSSDAWGPCPLFPGKAVSAQGWCKGWVPKQ